MTVAGIVLAAGASERMGTPKLLLPYDGGTVLGATVAAFTDADLDCVVVVTGHRATEIERSIEDRGVDIARNPDPDRGTMSSLLTGVQRVDADAYVYAPGDLPTLRSDTVDALAARWQREGCWAAVTAYRDRVGHPFLVSRAAVDAFAHETGDGVLWRGLVESADDRVKTIEVEAPAPVDVNTMADYESLLTGRHPPPGDD